MKIGVFFSIFCLLALPLFAQADYARIAPGATDRLEALRNKPTPVRPTTVTLLGEKWWYMDIDTHAFTDQASFKNVVEILQDVDGWEKTFNGRRTKSRASVVSREDGVVIADFVNTQIVPFLRIQFSVPFRTSVKVLESTDTKFLYEIWQIPRDSETNDKMRNLYWVFYVEEVTINGKNYVYARTYNRNNTFVNFSLPNIRNTIERSGDNANEDSLLLLLNAAKAL